MGRKPSTFGHSFTVLEFLNSRSEVDEGSIMFNPFSMLALKILKRSPDLFPSQMLRTSQEIAKKLAQASVLKSPKPQTINFIGLFVNCDKMPDTNKGGSIYSVSEYQRLLFTICGSIVPRPVEMHNAMAVGVHVRIFSLCDR